MAEHPIQGLMKTAMESIKEMVDVNTVIGTPVEAQDGSVIIPVSRVTFGFAAGGGDFEDQRPRRSFGSWGRRRGQQQDRRQQDDDDQDDIGHDRGGALPFAGGSGAGVSVQPVGFLIVAHGDVRLLSVDGVPMLERLIDLAPQLIDQIGGFLTPGNGSDSGGGNEDEESHERERQGKEKNPGTQEKPDDDKQRQSKGRGTVRRFSRSKGDKQRQQDD